MKRRTLLGVLAAGSASAALAQGWPQGLPRNGRGRVKEVLILLELRGGNDGFNTVIPVDDPRYHQARPTLAIRDGIPLRDGLALHPALAPLLPLWHEQRGNRSIRIETAVSSRSGRGPRICWMAV
jgi:uncharacterized protein (DUF1501 family)